MDRPALALVALVVAVTGSSAIQGSSVANGSARHQPASPAPDRQIALTFDDLPAVSTRRELDTWKEITEGLLRSLEQNRIPAIGFVNEGKLYVDGEVDPARMWLLRA